MQCHCIDGWQGWDQSPGLLTPHPGVFLTNFTVSHSCAVDPVTYHLSEATAALPRDWLTSSK